MARNILLKLTADPSQAERGLNGFSQKLERFSKQKTERLVDLQTKGAETRLKALNERLDRLGKQKVTPAVQLQMGRTAAQIDRTEKQLAGLGRTSERAGRGLRSTFGRAGALAGAVGVTYGLGRAISGVAENTVGFDRAMRNVNSIAQLSEVQFGALSRSVLGLAGRTAQAPETLAKGLYDLVSSGFNARESMRILASSAKAATAGLSTTEVSTKAVAAVLNAYHRPASDAAAISDTLFQTVNLGVISFDQLANTIGDVLPFASSLGVNLNQVGAAISTMTKAGIGPEETITRLKNVMVAFIKPSDGMKAAIKATGESSGEALVRHHGLQGALEALIKTTDGSKGAVAKLFPNIRGLGGALALTGKNAKGAEKDLHGFAHTGGATDKALSQQSKSISYQWNKVKAQFAAVSIELGTKLLPIASRALRAISRFIGQMVHGTGAGGRFARQMKRVADRIGDVLGFLSRHRHTIGVAIAAWALYRAAAAVAMAKTRLRLLGMFGGLGGPAARGGAASGSAFGRAFGIATAALLVAEAPSIMAEFADALFGQGNAFSEEARRRGFKDLGGLFTPENAGNADEMRSLDITRGKASQDAARHSATGGPTPLPGGGGRRRPGQSLADYLASIKRDSAKLDGTDSASRHRRRRRRRTERAIPSTAAMRAEARAAERYRQAVEDHGADSPEAKRAQQRFNIAKVGVEVDTDRKKLTTAIHRFGKNSEQAVKAQITLTGALTRLAKANDKLKDAVHKNTAALLPKPTDVAMPHRRIAAGGAGGGWPGGGPWFNHTGWGNTFVDKLVMPKSAAPTVDERYDAVKLHRHLRRLNSALPA